MERHERIAHAIAASGKKKGEIAAECGVANSAVTQWINGSSKSLKPENLYALAKATGFRPEWLAIGEGEPHQPATSDSEQCDQKPGGRQVGQHLAAGRALFDRMTPRSRTLVARILEMEAQGALTDEDIQMLEKIVERFGTTG